MNHKILAILLTLFGGVSIASAHVVVKPNQAGIGAFQTFSISVPSEKDSATVNVRLVLPDGLDYVTPTVKPGWEITTKTSGDNGSAKITEIIWSKGSVPAHLRDDFTFSAKVPSTPANLIWKAYQTYQNGEVVAWDIDADAQPKNASGSPDFSKSGPYSETKVIDDLTEASTTSSHSSSSSKSSTALILSIVAFILALKALRRKQ